MPDAKPPMDWLTFVSEMTSHLAWPATAVIVAVLLKDKIEGAIARIEKIRHGETEVSFGAGIKEVREVAENAGVTVSRPLTTFNPPILQAASASPPVAILESWKAVTAALKSLAERSGIDWSTPGRAIDALAARGDITSDLRAILQRLLRLRNTAVHEPSGTVTEGEALEFLMLARSMTERLQQIEPK